MISNKLLRHQEASINAIRMYPEIPFVFLIGGFGCGKLVPNNTLVQTPTGPARIDTLKIGDKVCGWHGVNTIENITTEETPELYHLVFSDGTSTTCCKDHLWWARTLKDKKEYKTYSTSYIIENFTPNKFRIPVCEPVQYASKELPIAPYTLGALIGDGHIGMEAHQYWITTMDPEVIENIQAEGYKVNYAGNNGSKANTYVVKVPRDKIPTEIQNTAYYKRIPRDYLYSSIDDRISLLQGLIDTDGYVDMKKDCPVLMFCTTSSFLADDVRELVQSLGGTVPFMDVRQGKYDGHYYAVRYAMRINLPEEIEKQSCTIPRKLDRLKGRLLPKRVNERKIVSIIPVPSQPGRCLSTDGDNSYLLNDYIVTHNSFTDVQLCLFLYHAYKNSPEPITIGILGVTIKLLKQTVIADLERAFDAGNISYRDNSQAGTITVGQITFVYLAMQNPDDIYAFNFHCAICDEIDEVPSERVQKIVTAIQERCRVRMPEGKDMPSRDPFIFFSTTAQGLGGTYQLIRYMQKKGLPYIKIRGRTQDNTNLAKSQLDLLRGLYTEEEARAYLDGEFINLSTGRVYPEFDARKHKYMSFPVIEGKCIEMDEVHRDRNGKVVSHVCKYEGGDVIYVGQDFNAGYNAATSCIVRGENIFVIGEDHWNYVGDAFRILRDRYPNNKIVMIPDANGKEIMNGFMEEAEQYNVEVFWNNINPSILERVTAINKALRFGNIKVFEGLERVLLCLETRDFDDSGKPRKGKGPDALDHWGDSLEYAVWHIIHQIQGFDIILQAIKAVHHTAYTYDE